MKKVSRRATKLETVLRDKPEITVGLDLGDRFSQYCFLSDGGGSGRRGPHGEHTKRRCGRHFEAEPRLRIALECGTHSPWVSRLLTAAGPPGDRGQRAQDSGHHRQRIEERPQRRRTTGAAWRLTIPGCWRRSSIAARSGSRI